MTGDLNPPLFQFWLARFDVAGNQRNSAAGLCKGPARQQKLGLYVRRVYPEVQSNQRQSEEGTRVGFCVRACLASEGVWPGA